LYLSVKDHRKFFDALNWKHPYKGFMQSLAIRTISGGLYFPLNDIFKPLCGKLFGKNSFWTSYFSGNLAGVVNGAILAPCNAVKYHLWGIEERVGFDE
jgi:hypothetical protein